MIINNIKVYDLEESILASGYPMSIEIVEREVEEKDINRVKKLTKLSRLHNPAHGQWLTGVRVNFDLTFTNKAWVEAERYRFLEFVSSQSTMHRITKFDIRNQYNEYVDPRVIDIMEEKVAKYNKLVENKPNEKAAKNLVEDYEKLLKDLYLQILYTNPSGFQLTARMTTNYRCLLNIYIQRYDHRLPEWREFCEELLKLPMFKELLEYYYPGFLTIK